MRLRREGTRVQMTRTLAKDILPGGKVVNAFFLSSPSNGARPMRKNQDTFQKVMPSSPDKSLRQHFHNLRRNLNRPIIETDAKSRGYKLPSQKQYKELSALVMSIEAVEALRFTISTKLTMATDRAAQRAERHKERYKREPHLAKRDPHNYVNNNTVQSLKSRQKAIEALYSQLVLAYKELAGTDYKQRSNANAPL